MQLGVPKPDNIPELNLAPNRRGVSNTLRKGVSKIHRRYEPTLMCPVPRGMAQKVVSRISSHNWHRNHDLIKLRQTGYVPYTKRNDRTYIPKPMRISARSESCQALTTLSLALAANCDYNADNELCFEIMAPFEQIAAAMGMLHVYENGRKAYDSPLSALSVQEQLGYVVVLHGKDTDTGQNKPLRIWLTEKFFTSRGIAVEEIRRWLGKYKVWARKRGLSESLRKTHERHLLRLERIGIDLKSRHSLRNRLKQIKRIVCPDLAKEKTVKIETLEKALQEQDPSRLDTELDSLNKELRGGKTVQNATNVYELLYRDWYAKSIPIKEMQREKVMRQKYPELIYSDRDEFYRLLLESAGQIT